MNEKTEKGNRFAWLVLDMKVEPKEIRRALRTGGYTVATPSGGQILCKNMSQVLKCLRQNYKIATGKTYRATK